MDIVIEAAAEAVGELLSAGIDAVVDKAAKHKSKYKSEYRRKHTMAIKSLIINPGSTSTKIGVFEDENLLFEETLRHSTEEISKYDTIFEQKDFRKKIITDLLAEKNCDLKSFNVIVAPRSDLGDSIRKAFSNVDDILTDMSLEKTSENQRAVRILAYNSMEITPENIEKVKEADRQVSAVVDRLTPKNVLQMIRDGVNPLEKTFDELESYFSQNPESYEEEVEDYSRFLYQLERKKDVTEEERKAYIGIYRMVHQVEREDGAAVGAVACVPAAAVLHPDVHPPVPDSWSPHLLPYSEAWTDNPLQNSADPAVPTVRKFLSRQALHLYLLPSARLLFPANTFLCIYADCQTSPPDHP